MSRAAVIGEVVRTAGFALAGALVATAETPEEARAAWRALPADVAVLVLTPRAAAWLGDTGLGDTGLGDTGLGDTGRPGPLVVVMPP